LKEEEFSSHPSRFIGFAVSLVGKPKRSPLLTAVPIQIPILEQTLQEI